MFKKKESKRKNHWKVIVAASLSIYVIITMLITFVIPQNTVSIDTVNKSTSSFYSTSLKNTKSNSSSKANAEVTSNSYTSDSLKVTITEKTVDNTCVYIADICVTDPSLLLSGLAGNTFGRNVTEKTSSIAESVNAVIAINGDFYGFRDTGYVLRNGYLYRDTPADEDQEDLVVYEDGKMDIVKESDFSAEELVEKGAVQIYSFGPGLVSDGEITVSDNDEVGQSMASNPRTAIGMISTGHYVMVVSDGRTSESQGLTLKELAEVMKDTGCTEAYNLDGGGSTTMYFNGEVVNKPTTNGNHISERKVSDIVYFKDE